MSASDPRNPERYDSPGAIAARRPRTGIATVCLSGTLDDKLDAAAHAGFDGVEIFENDLVVSSWTPEQIHRRCADLGLSVDLYQPLRDFDACTAEVFAANLRRAERKLDLMRRLGADTVLVCSSTSQDAVADDDRIAEQLRALADKAAERGLKVAYEALAWGRVVNTYQRSWEIVRRADHPALGLCLDSFHVLSRRDDPAGIRAIPGSKIFFLQLADAPPLAMDVVQWSRHHRLFPGQGDFDLTGFLTDVLATGYEGPLSLEVFNDVFRQADPRAAAVDALRSLLALQERVPHRRSAPLPAPPELAGHAFTEMAVDEVSRHDVSRALEGLGFARTGQHRSKPVQLWEQGGARVLLNVSPQRDGVASVGALGVDSADPDRSARRAQALLAPQLPRTRGAGEADLPVVAAPDGTSLFFCRTGDPWIGDFTATGAQAGRGGITGTDHVALTQPFDRFDEASLFYRSVLGLGPQAPAEFAAPFGLVRSHAVTSASSGVRIALNVAMLRRGDWAPGVRAPQHVAFSTDDVFGCARAARARGAPILPIPGNYYEDLDARLDLPPDHLEAMRECDVLHDQDEHGQYLHFYTEVFGDRVFFEVVQRIDGYAGFGAANAAVRMAAHRALRLSRRGPATTEPAPGARSGPQL